MLPQSIVRARTGLMMLVYNLFRIRRPLTSQILVTKYCNMDCKMCFVYPLDKKAKMKSTPEPTFEQLEYLIDESWRLGAQVIIPFGGEPLLRKDIGEIIQAIKKRNRYCILYTNGTFVKDKIKDLLLLDQLIISVDGEEAVHDRIRGAGSYKKAIEAIETALGFGIVCRLHTALIPDTLGTLPHMAYLSNKYNVMINYGSCDATALTKPAENRMSLSRDEVIRFLKRYHEFKNSGVKISTPAKTIRELIRVMENWPVEEGILSKVDAKRFAGLKIPACALAFSNVYIDSDGSVYPCLPLWGREEKAPNAYEIGLKKAWDYYKDIPCYQCASIFTIEKSLFYSFNPETLIQYLLGYEFLRTRT